MGIAAIYIKSSADDVALVKVGEGISAEPFTLANESLKIGDQAELTGHGQTHDYTPSVLTVISERVAFLNFGNVTYTDLFKETSATLSRSCGGGGEIQEALSTKTLCSMPCIPSADSTRPVVMGKIVLCGTPTLFRAYLGLRTR